jgi:hypothetical protein
MAELELCLALDPDGALASLQALGEREKVALGKLVEPDPWWTVSTPERRTLPESAQRTMVLVRAMGRAIAGLRGRAPVVAIEVDTPSRPDVFDAGVMDEALAPCRPREALEPGPPGEDEVGPCPPPRVLALGTVGVSLLRPLLAEWPASQVDPDALRGESKEDLGWALQLIAAANATAVIPPRGAIELFAPAAGVAAGLSYRWGTYLPGRVNRPLFELNAGISEALQYDSHGHSGGNLHVTFLDQELRWPVAWELLTSYPLPLDLAKGHEAGWLLFFSGARVHEVIANPTPAFWGVELEVASIALSAGRGAYPLYASSPELRLYLGAADPHATQPSLPAAWGATVGIEFVGGYATFL